MERPQVLSWLEKRRHLCSQKNATHVDNEDVNFIREYIYHYKSISINFSDLVDQLQRKTHNQFIVYLDFMINKLIHDFDIKMETTPVPFKIPIPGINTQDSTLIIKYY